MLYFVCIGNKFEEPDLRLEIRFREPIDANLQDEVKRIMERTALEISDVVGLTDPNDDVDEEPQKPKLTLIKNEEKD